MEPTPAQKAYLEQTNVAILATTGPGSRAHAMPVWYVYEDGQIIIGAGANSQKRRNIDRNGQATLVIDRREPPYHALMVQGTAEVGPAAPPELRLKIATRYLGERRGPRVRRGDGRRRLHHDSHYAAAVHRVRQPFRVSHRPEQSNRRETPARATVRL